MVVGGQNVGTQNCEYLKFAVTLKKLWVCKKRVLKRFSLKCVCCCFYFPQSYGYSKMLWLSNLVVVKNGGYLKFVGTQICFILMFICIFI